MGPHKLRAASRSYGSVAQSLRTVWASTPTGSLTGTATTKRDEIYQTIDRRMR